MEKAHFASGEAAAAQEWLVKQPERIRKLAAFARRKRDAADAKGSVHAHFSWLFNSACEAGIAFAICKITTHAMSRSSEEVLI